MVCLFFVTLFAIVSLIYHIVYICYIKPKQEKIGKDQVMLELEMKDINVKMKRMMDEESIFKKVVPKNNTLLNYSKQVH